MKFIHMKNENDNFLYSISFIYELYESVVNINHIDQRLYNEYRKRKRKKTKGDEDEERMKEIIPSS